MRAFLAWTAAAAVSVMLGVTLYSTSLQGSTTGYEEAAASPRPVPTVVKRTTKVVRKPGRTKVVYVPQPSVQSYPQAPTQQSVTLTDSTVSAPRQSQPRHQDDDD